MPGGDNAVLVTAGKEQQRAVRGGDVIEEDRDVHGARFRHVVIAFPGAVILMPLPDIAVERGLRIHLVLMHVDRPVEHLHHRVDQARVTAEPPEALVIGMRGEGGAGNAGRFPPDFFPLHRVDGIGLAFKQGGFLRRKPVRKEKVSVAVELFGFLLCQIHEALSGNI